MKEEAIARLALACLVLIGIWFGLITFLLITQTQILAVVNIISSTAAGYGLGPAMTGLAVILGIQIFSGTNLLITLGVVMNQIFFGNYWYLDYSIRSMIIYYLIGVLAGL